MKKHAIIPIFIPNMGCGLSCVFCDQKTITARTSAPTPQDVRDTVDTWLTTLINNDGSSPTVEIAFYGGSFTAIPVALQEAYLSVAKEYIDCNKASSIHISTRPDCIDTEILNRLATYEVRTIELGVQSFSDQVLMKSKRGHDSNAVYEACDLIKNYRRDGEKEPFFNLGIQLMIGLPGDSMELDIYSAMETARIKPHLARIYPTLVLEGTELMEMFKNGDYIPLTREDAIQRSKAVYKILEEAGIYIMRVGLKSTDIINSENLGEINAGAYHPAFRQLVESAIAKERLEKLIQDHLSKNDNLNSLHLYSSPLWLSNMIGQRGENKLYFQNKYPEIQFDFRVDPELSSGDFRIDI